MVMPFFMGEITRTSLSEQVDRVVREGGEYSYYRAKAKLSPLKYFTAAYRLI
jgi:hypothetical protein